MGIMRSRGTGEKKEKSSYKAHSIWGLWSFGRLQVSQKMVPLLTRALWKTQRGCGSFWFTGRSRAKLEQLEGKLQQEARKLRMKDWSLQRGSAKAEGERDTQLRSLYTFPTFPALHEVKTCQHQRKEENGEEIVLGSMRCHILKWVSLLPHWNNFLDKKVPFWSNWFIWE